MSRLQVLTCECCLCQTQGRLFGRGQPREPGRGAGLGGSGSRGSPQVLLPPVGQILPQGAGQEPQGLGRGLEVGEKRKRREKEREDEERRGRRQRGRKKERMKREEEKEDERK